MFSLTNKTTEIPDGILFFYPILVFWKSSWSFYFFEFQKLVRYDIGSLFIHVWNTQPTTYSIWKLINDFFMFLSS